jgi:hypothetical protein
MLKSIFAAASLLVVVGATSTSAAVVPKTGLVVDNATVVEVQGRRDYDRRDRFDRRDRRGHHWVPGRRYDRAPPRWRRYGSRPHDWRRRGCVIVGPVWFCP